MPGQMWPYVATGTRWRLLPGRCIPAHGGLMSGSSVPGLWDTQEPSFPKTPACSPSCCSGLNSYADKDGDGRNSAGDEIEARGG